MIEARRTRLLRSLLGGGLLYFLLFVTVHALLAFTTGRPGIADLACLVLVALPQLLLILQPRLDLPDLQTALVCAALAAAAWLGLSTTESARPGDTYSAWFFGAITFDLLGLAILGRFRSAWITMTAVLGIAVAWALLHGLPAPDGAGLVVRHIATLLVGTALAFSLRRSNAAFAVFRAVRLRRGAEEEAARARAAARRAAVEQVLEQAGPTLRAIAAGRPFSDEDRRQMLALEGALRDQIRTPLLVRGPLKESVASARRRGVNVLLMDEAEQVDSDARAHATIWLAERLDAVGSGGFVGRLRQLDDALRVSAVGEEHGEARSFPVSAPHRGS